MASWPGDRADLQAEVLMVRGHVQVLELQVMLPIG